MPQPNKTYKTIELKIPPHLVDHIQGVTKTQGTWQRPFQRINESLKKVGSEYSARVREEDVGLMQELADEPGEGSYQSWAHEILKCNGMLEDDDDDC